MGSKKDKDHPYVVGVDLGGTKVVSAVYDSDYEKLASKKEKTLGHESPDEIVSRLLGTISRAMEKAGVKADQLAGIGIGSPGPLDIETGTILDTPNLNLKNFCLKACVEKEFGCPVIVDNDVNVGTYGEYRFGAGRGCRHIVGIFPGTGIGGGLVLEGKLFHGATGAAGEIGHMIIQAEGPRCGCGQYGCLEALASRTAVAKDVVAIAASGDAPTILDSAGTDLKKVKSKALLKSVEAGETAVSDVLRRSAEFLGMGMANCVNLLSPEVIVIGGGLVEKLGTQYVDWAAESMRRHAMPFLVENVRVAAAELGDDAGLLGAACLMREHLAEAGE